MMVLWGTNNGEGIECHFSAGSLNGDEWKKKNITR